MSDEKRYNAGLEYARWFSEKARKAKRNGQRRISLPVGWAVAMADEIERELSNKEEKTYDRS